MLENPSRSEWKARRPKTAQSRLSSLSSYNYQGADNDSGYSSRPSTSSRSIRASRKSEGTLTEVSVVSAAGQQTNSYVQNSNGDSSRMLESTKAASTKSTGPLPSQTPTTVNQNSLSRYQTPRRPVYEPKQFARWRSHMNNVAARVDSRWTTPNENGSQQSADMMKYKLTSSEQSVENTDSEDGESIRLRSVSRENRVKPWNENSSRRTSSTSSGRKLSGANGHVAIHYERMLPASQWVECKPKKYVTNHRHGHHYQIRPTKSTKYKYAPSSGMKFLWENNCQVWLMEKLKSTNFETQRQRIKTGESAANAQRLAKEEALASTANQKTSLKRPKTAPVTSRELSAEQENWKNRLFLSRSGDKSNVFDKFVDWSMDKQKRKYAAISIQRHVKGWLDRMRIKRLRERAMHKHGTNWKAFCNDYKSLLARIQRRCGDPKPSCPMTYKDIEQFMIKKEKYEEVFNEMKDENQMLPRNQIMPLFRKCGLFPLEREVKSAFRAVFKGCSVQSDVVFLLDCSASIGSAVYDMQLGLIRDIIGHCEVSYDKIRVAVIPYNDDVFRVIDFESYGSKDELMAELANLTYETVRTYGQITRTDIALRCMTEIVQKAHTVRDHIRDGSHVPKLCFAFTDGKCYHTQLTAKWAEFARQKLKVTMFAVTCSDEAKTQPYLLDIASEEDRVLKLTEYKTLGAIKSAIQGQMCLKSCPLCHYAQKSTKNGVLCSDERRGLFKQEVLELIWMVYCPPATGLKKYRDSLWMSPQVEGQETMKLARYHPVGTNYRDCLRIAVEERIAQTGKVILPTETGVRVREISNVDLAMDFIDQLCVTKLSSLGLVEKVGLNVKVPAKYA